MLFKSLHWFGNNCEFECEQNAPIFLGISDNNNSNCFIVYKDIGIHMQ